MPYEFIDHTADIGIKIWAKSLSGVFEEAARALFDIITDISQVRPKKRKTIKLKRPSLDELLVEWLTELLYLHEVENMLFCKFKINSLDNNNLVADIFGEEFKEKKHIIKTEIKAVTYHKLTLLKEDNSWKAMIILDL